MKNKFLLLFIFFLVSILLSVLLVAKGRNRIDETSSDLSDFPIFPGSVQIKTSKEKIDKVTVYTYSYEIKDESQDEVMEWYEDDQLPTEWIFLEPLTIVSSTRQQIKVKKDKREALVVVEQEDSSSPVLLTISIKKHE